MNKKLIIPLVAAVIFLAGCGNSVPEQEAVELDPIVPVVDEGAQDGGVPDGCVTWFDGCNTCQVGVPGGQMACTMMACMETQEPYCMKYEDGSSDAPMENNVSAEVKAEIENATYIVEGQEVKLNMGKGSTEVESGSALKIMTQTTDDMTEGALQQGVRESIDAAVVLVQNPGGSGTFYYVGAVLEQKDGSYITTGNTFLLGDRIVVKEMKIDNHVLQVTYLDRGADEAMAEDPTVEMIKKYTLKDDVLVEMTLGEDSTEGEQVVGNDKDEHGCIGSAGYSWSEEKQECIRPWEEK